MMNITEQICKEAGKLPEHLAREVLEFIRYIEMKHNLQDKEIQNLKETQLISMRHIWDNEEDSVWDEY